MEELRPEKDYSKLRVGSKNIEDAIYKLGDLSALNRSNDKADVLFAIERNNLSELRQYSNAFYRTSGIYSGLCDRIAYIYNYDWMVTPYVLSDSVKKEKLLSDYDKILIYLDNSNIKKILGEISLKVVKNGCYYGYLVKHDSRFVIQELDVNYCRSRFYSKEGTPVVEFNMKYFDDTFRDEAQRTRILNVFPKDFQLGYAKYKKGLLPAEAPGDSAGWYMLDPQFGLKFSLTDDDTPLFISTIPALIDLDHAQALDRKRMEQQLLKIIIQKLPRDKNGDIIFAPIEAKALHDNAQAMIGDAIGIKVLTTPAEPEVAEIASNAGNNANDESMDRALDAVFNQSGTSKQHYNTDGNLALDKSTVSDEARMYKLVQQFEVFLNSTISHFNKNSKKLYFKIEILKTTIYNYKDISKLYKEQTQLGYSKFAPQIALGRSQSAIMASAYFENEILDLTSVFIPPMSSNTMSANNLNKNNNTSKTGGNASNGEVGRPEKPDDQKSEKTLKNIESM